MSDVDAETLKQPQSIDRLSVLGQLQQRREEIRASELLTLPVPRWTDPEIYVRYKPIDHTSIRHAQQRIERAPAKEKITMEINGNIDLLVKGCEAVFARLDGQDYSLRPDEPKSEFTRFDPDLAANLGLDENATARDVVRALFHTDGDIVSHAEQLVRFSGYREAQADQELLGE